MKDLLKLKIPPAVQFIVGVSGIWLIKELIPNQSLLMGLRDEIALFLLTLAGIYGVLALIAFYRSSTSVNPHKPQNTSSLVTGGVYQISRNPMYLALLLGLLAAVFYWGNLYSALIPSLFIWYMNEFQIIPEEETLEEKFGAAWKQYANEVRRWI